MTRIGRRLEWAQAAIADGDDPVAAVLLDLLERDAMLTPEVALDLVPAVWDLCSAPMLVLSVESWVGLFQRAGYTHDFAPAERPTNPVQLFRGSDPRGELGMCWSTNPDVARWLATHYDDGRVWTTLVDPLLLLAFIAPTYEDQFVVDTRGLRPEVFEGPEMVAGLDPEQLAARLDALVDARLEVTSQGAAS